MNTPSNAMPESRLDSPRVAPAALSATRPFYWSVRRELWENRSIYIAPLAVAALFLFGFTISLIHLPAKIRAASALDSMQLHQWIEQPYDIGAGLIMVTTLLVAAFYCLDALHGERRDRSILFWKSLPVSDLTTVLAKASIPVVVLPLLTFAITIATYFIMLVLSDAALVGSGQSVTALGANLPLFRISAMLFFHLLLMHGFGFAPVYCWLLLVSAWARRAAFLWALLPLIAIGVVEKIALNTSHFAALLAFLLGSGANDIPFPLGSSAMDMPIHLNIVKFLTSAGLWIDVMVATAFLAAAVRLRRYQGPI